MAHDDFSLSIGLNEIASLSGHDMDSETRRKTGLSRIPKINFSFRHKASPARTASPEVDSGDRNGIGSVKSAPNSKRGSPVSRSKSLRLPRSNYIAKCHSSSAVASMGRQEEEEEELGGGKRGLQRDSRISHLKPRARANTGTISNPGSRSSSPAGLRMTPQSLTDSSSSSTELQFEANGGITEAPSPHFHRRSQSFHSSARQRTQARASNLSVRDRGVVRPSSAGRSKTPTSSSRYGSHKTATSSSEPRNMPITRTNSVGQIVKESSNSRSSTPPRRVYRTDSSGSLSSTSRRSKGKRPSSVIVTDNTADLNKLAQEIAGSFVMSETSEPEMKSVSRVSSETSQVRRRSGTFTRIPTVRGVKSPTDRGSSSSPTEKDAPKSYEQPTVSSRAKLLHGRRSLDQDSSQRPNSARAYYSYQQTPPHETTQATARGEEETLRSQPSAEKLPADETDFGVRAAVAAVSKRTRSSTPSSSGRGSPVPKEDKVSLKQGSRTSPTGEAGSGSGQVPMVTVSRVTGLPPRTPYRVARTRASTLAGSELAMGINELQGSVLLEADDYRRISNDVRGLKTALLRLKRELQGDQQDTPSSTPSNALTGRRGSPAGTGPSGSFSELNKKLQLVTSERDKAREEVTRLKKDLKSRSTRVTQITSELKNLKEEKEKEAENFKQIEAHRDLLLDKVERIHADKHKLEDKLNSLEKIRFYERTLSESAWLDEGEEEEDETLGLEGRLERKETESDIGDSLMLSDGGEGESSEPESAAVCSAPFS